MSRYLAFFIACKQARNWVTRSEGRGNEVVLSCEQQDSQEKISRPNNVVERSAFSGRKNQLSAT